MDEINKNKYLINVFYGKSSLVYVFKKLSKIASAVYIISEYIKDTEPLKQTLRESALSLINDTGNLKDIRNFATNSMSAISLLKTNIEIGFSAKLISSMNALILSKELDDVSTILVNEIENSLDHSIPKDYLKTEREEDSYFFNLPFGLKKSNEKESVLFKGQYKRHNHNDVLYTKKTEKNFNSINLNSSKNDRRKNIINIIKNKKKVSIKDISELIRDCSEKTIQRELNVLLDQNIIEKEGEKRWSKYYIKDSLNFS